MCISLKCVLFLVFLLQMLNSASPVQTSLLNESGTSTSSAVEKFKNMERMIRDQVESLTDLVLPKIYDIIPKLKIEKQCMKEVLQLARGLRDLKPWALKFVDASGKGIDGAMNGAIMSFGSYDECLDIRVPNKRHPQEAIFQGQYCTIDFMPYMPKGSEWDEFEIYFRNISNEYPVLKPYYKYVKSIEQVEKYNPAALRVGTCVPSGCTRDDINEVVKMVADIFVITGQATRCEMKEEVKFSPDEIFAICCFCALVLLLLIATFLDAYPNYTKRIVKCPLSSVLLEFSFTRNITTLMNTKNSNDDLRCLNGIRCMTTVWLVWAHCYLILDVWGLRDLLFYMEAPKTLPFTLLTNSTLTTDTFFFIGGFLICHKIVKSVKCNNSNFSVFSHISTRLIRIWPSYVFILISLLLTNKLGSGPIWHDTIPTPYDLENCRLSWWKNLLFISNYFSFKDMCLPHTWYLDVDFQLYLLAPAFILPLIKWTRAGVMLILAAIVATDISFGIISYIYSINPVLHAPEFLIENLELQFRFYLSPLLHLGPYFVGFLAGYIYTTNSKLKIPLKFQMIGWTLALVCNFSVMYSIKSWIITPPPMMARAVYGSVSRTLWAVSLAWITICCATGNGGLVNKLLSWKPLIPFSNISFMVYMLHPIVIILYQQSKRSATTFSHLTMTWYFFGCLVASIMAAFVGSILIEYPFNTLGKKMFKENGKKVQNNPNSMELSNGVTNQSFEGTDKA